MRLLQGVYVGGPPTQSAEALACLYLKNVKNDFPLMFTDYSGVELTYQFENIRSTCTLYGTHGYMYYFFCWSLKLSLIKTCLGVGGRQIAPPPCTTLKKPWVCE